MVVVAERPLAVLGCAAQRLCNWVTLGRRRPLTGLDKRLLVSVPACHVLCGLCIGRGAQAIECGLEDWSGIAGAAVDRGDGDHHVENLFKGEIVTDFAGVLRSGQKRPAGGDDPGAVGSE